MTSMTRKPLTVADVLALASIVNAAAVGAHVGREIGGTLTEGTARSIGDVVSAHMAPGDDIRDCYLRVTGKSGFDYYWPVAELVGDFREGLFAVGM